MTYDRVDDDGLHVTVDGEPRVLDVDTRRGLRRPGVGPRRCTTTSSPPASTAHLIGGADVAAELDAKRAIEQGTELAAAL